MLENFLILFSFFLINFFLIIYFSKIKFFFYNIDQPDNLRKIHKKPVPLAGGILIILNLFIYFLLINFENEIFNQEIIFNDKNSLNIFFLISFCFFLLGFFDDKFNIPANIKFLISTLILLSLTYLDKGIILNDIKFSFYNKSILLNEYKIFFTIFCFLVFTNAFNMFDGINLQSSLYSIFILSCILFFYSYNLLINVLLISLIGFAYLNYRNKAFLGDSGSLLLAFIIGYIFIKLYNLNFIEYSDKVAIYMLIPGIDLIRLFILRILKKRNPLSSDKLHLHHILLKYFSQYQTLSIILFFISTPIILDYLNINNIITVSVTIILYFCLLTVIKIKE